VPLWTWPGLARVTGEHQILKKYTFFQKKPGKKTQLKNQNGFTLVSTKNRKVGGAN
jgi:hypothetical protein